MFRAKNGVEGKQSKTALWKHTQYKQEQVNVYENNEVNDLYLWLWSYRRAN